jgi:uncharacterized membrane protein YfcA
MIVAMVISFFTSMAGISGAFLILPYQMSYLGFTSPAVSGTNLVYNIVAIPSGVYRYLREGRLIWPLAWILIAGSLPGIIVGALIRIVYLPDPGNFRIFVAVVLLYIGGRLALELRGGLTGFRNEREAGAADWTVHVLEFNWRRLSFRFQERVYEASAWRMFALALAVGMVGGIYGIGGGAIIAPFLVAAFGLPVHAVAGATLMATFVTSAAGALFYQAIAPAFEKNQFSVAPDWGLGALFGLGGFVGVYLGARVQRFVPANWLKLMIALLVLLVAVRYLAVSL